MVPELPLQQISASSTTGYLFQLATSYLLSTSRPHIGPGPLLFLAYIDDIPQCIQHDSKIQKNQGLRKCYQPIREPNAKADNTYWDLDILGYHKNWS